MGDPLVAMPDLSPRVEGYVTAYVFIEVRRLHPVWTREEAMAICARCGWRSHPCEGEPYNGIGHKLGAAALGGRHTCMRRDGWLS